MKLLPLTLAAALALAVACGSNNGNKNSAPGTPAAATKVAASAGAGTPVPTTRLGTPRPGATPRPSPIGSATAAACATPTALPSGVPPIPAGAGELQTTASGLQYQDIVVGTGPAPTPGQKVTVNYTGYLDDGAVFDSSLKPGRTPFEFTPGKGEVIKGWDEGVPTMKVGGKRRLYIPYALAYGARGQPPTIPACSRLTFDVELLK